MVTTTSASASPNSAGSPCWRPAPWCTTTCRSGANRRDSASQLWTTLSGHTTRCGPGRSMQVGERRGRLAEPHVVGEAPAEPDPREELHPRQPAALVVAQLAVEPRRLDDLLEAFVGQPGEQRRHPAVRRRAPIVERRPRRGASELDGDVAVGRRPPADRRSSSTAPDARRVGRGARRAARAPGAGRPGRCAPSGARCAASVVPAASTRARSAVGQRRARRSPPASRRAPPCRSGPCDRRPATRGRCRGRRTWP